MWSIWGTRTRVWWISTAAIDRLIDGNREGPPRIVAAADVFDALTSERPYKQAWPLETAFEYLKTHAGSQFDPVCVAAVLQSREAFCAIHRQYRDPVIT